MREGGRARESPRERALPPRPGPGQAFIAFLGTLHGGWSSFSMHRFTTGDHLLRTTKDRILLITSKRRMLQLKGETFAASIQGEGVLARASLIAVKVQCSPDFPLENLSMDVGLARQPCSPLAFPSGG